MNYYRTLEILLLILILLNIADSLTTMVGLSVEGTVEGNPVVQPLTKNISTFLWIKLGMLTFVLLSGLAYLLKLHHAFPKLWENEVAVGLASLVVVFYAGVVINNLFIIF